MGKEHKQDEDWWIVNGVNKSNKKPMTFEGVSTNRVIIRKDVKYDDELIEKEIDGSFAIKETSNVLNNKYYVAKFEGANITDSPKKKNSSVVANDINLFAYKGNILALYSPKNPATSSAIARSLTGSVYRESGVVEVNGVNMSNKTKKSRVWLKNYIGKDLIYLSPENDIFDERFTIQENLLDGIKKKKMVNAFINSFDNTTVWKLNSILLDNDPLTKLVIDRFFVDENSNEGAYGRIYVQALNEINSANKDGELDLALDYLSSRKKLREEFIVGKDVDKRKIRSSFIDYMVEIMYFDREILVREFSEINEQEKKLLLLVKAALNSPNLLILDNFISTLTGTYKKRAISFLKTLRDGSNTTVVFTTNDIKEAYELSDHIAVFLNGNMIEYGETSDIAKTPLHPHTLSMMSGKELNKDVKVSGNWFKVNDPKYGFSHYIKATKEQIAIWAKGVDNGK